MIICNIIILDTVEKRRSWSCQDYVLRQLDELMQQYKKRQT